MGSQEIRRGNAEHRVEDRQLSIERPFESWITKKTGLCLNFRCFDIKMFTYDFTLFTSFKPIQG